VTLVGTIAGGPNTTHTLAVDNVSGFLYSAGSNLSNGGLLCFSLANPANPVLVGSWNTTYIHECQVYTYTTGPYAGKQIAFVFCGQQGFYILDVTDKANIITMAGPIVYPGVRYCHQGWLSEDRTLLYINDEIDGPAQGVVYGLTRIFNVSNLSAPVQQPSYTNVISGAIDHNLYVRGNYMYMSNYTSGLRVADLSNPIAPVEVAWIDTYPEDDDASYDGDWNNWPFFPSNNIIISDIQRGLFVVRVNLNYLTFSFPAPLPTLVTPGAATPVTFDVNTTPGGSPVNPGSVQMFLSVNNGAFTPINATQVDSNTFSATIPPQSCGAALRYYFSANNTQPATFTSPSNAPTSFYSATAIIGTTTILGYDMETDAGWTGGQPGDTATTGQWERGDPEPTIAQPGDDHTPGAGINCWVTGRLAGTGSGSFDVDGGFTTLLSPALALATADPDVRIGYWRWYDNGRGGSANTDTFRVDISNNNGASWVNAETVGPAGTGTSGGWIRHEFRVADFSSLTNQMRVRFVADDAGAGSLIEAAIDDFQVFEFACGSPACDPIDFNNDGVSPDTQDLVDYLSVFGGGACSTDPTPGCNDIDFNNDGVSPDSDDIDALLRVFGGGIC
jgi:hypothetical protein